MKRWLIKSDPGEYGFDELLRDKRTTWDGVRNPQALLYLREMKKGDDILFYHTGVEKQIVGVAEVSRGPYPDPTHDAEKLVVVDITAKNRLQKPVTLAFVKADWRFAEFALIKQSRLSVMPVPDSTWRALMALASG